VEQELAAGLCEGQIAEFIEDDEVHAGQMIGETALASIPDLGLEPVDEIDHIVEPTAGAAADAASNNGNGKMGFAGAGPADQNDVAMLGDEAASGEVADEGLIDLSPGRYRVGGGIRGDQRRRVESAPGRDLRNQLGLHDATDRVSWIHGS